MPLLRGSGILLHPTSLPGKFGIGDMGSRAYQFIDFLVRSGQRYWQILPLNPVNYDLSPYQSFSAFAGNILLISPELLVTQGLLEKKDLEDIPDFKTNTIDYNQLIRFKETIFRKAFKKFENQKDDAFLDFKNKNKFWLDNFSLFMACKTHFQGRAWNQWDEEIAKRIPPALEYYKINLREEIKYNDFLQYLFFTQWKQLKAYAEKFKIKIIGDLPIFVSYDSSDVWANRHFFKLDKQGNPLTVAGVPPDYFSPTGQLWGNPHYRWDELEREGYIWWLERIKHLNKLTDIIRIDHFRGFIAFWEIPVQEKTAIHGRWVQGPGEKFFQAIEKELGKVAIIAEDLGVITQDVIELRNKFCFPGMQILQFILNEHCLQDTWDIIEENSVVYTGTHDNDTILGWYKKNYCKKFPALNLPEEETPWYFIEMAYKSRANIAIIPMQDILALDSESRMNFPGTATGNWQWRLPEDYINKGIEEKLATLAKIYHR